MSLRGKVKSKRNMQGFMMDGNFQAEHMKMRNPENDIPLSEGTGFMVS